MDIIKRKPFELIKSKLEPGKVLLLYGPRRVGKTTLLKQLLEDSSVDGIKSFLNGEQAIIQKQLTSRSIEQFKGLIGTSRILIIDEAQHVPEIGLCLKLMVDHFSEIAIIASGSSSFSLAQDVGEPLTGRKKTIHIYPLSAEELIDTKGSSAYLDSLESTLIYGCYPEIQRLPKLEDKQEYLRELVDSYLYRDILELEKVRRPKKIRDLLTLLTFQIGKEVSHTELAVSLQLNQKTVERYLDLLEQSFVLINIRGFSRNLRKEVTKTSRYYFYDPGIRNALINNFNPLSLRDDVGMLWENYIVIERLKKQAYSGIISNNYFWRTYDQKEIDWVEEREGQLFGYEISWQKKNKAAPKDWLTQYPNARFMNIHQGDFLEFIT